MSADVEDNFGVVMVEYEKDATATSKRVDHATRGRACLIFPCNTARRPTFRPTMSLSDCRPHGKSPLQKVSEAILGKHCAQTISLASVSQNSNHYGSLKAFVGSLPFSQCSYRRYVVEPVAMRLIVPTAFLSAPWSTHYTSVWSPARTLVKSQEMCKQYWSYEAKASSNAKERRGAKEER